MPDDSEAYALKPCDPSKLLTNRVFLQMLANKWLTMCKPVVIIKNSSASLQSFEEIRTRWK